MRVREREIGRIRLTLLIQKAMCVVSLPISYPQSASALAEQEAIHFFYHPAAQTAGDQSGHIQVDTF